MNSFTYDYPVRNYFGEGAMDQALDAEMGAMAVSYTHLTLPTTSRV